jgi:hypothetical protein
VPLYAQCAFQRDRLGRQGFTQFGHMNHAIRQGQARRANQAPPMSFDHLTIVGPGAQAEIALEIFIAFGGLIVHGKSLAHCVGGRREGEGGVYQGECKQIVVLALTKYQTGF